MFAQLVKPGIKRMVNEIFNGVSYLLTQQEYDDLIGEETVIRRFAVSWDALVLSFKGLSFLVLLITGRSYTE